MFSFFRFPSLVYEEIIKCLDIEEMYNLSQCSKKSFRNVSIMVKRLNISFELCLTDEFSLTVCHGHRTKFQFESVFKLKGPRDQSTHHFCGSLFSKWWIRSKESVCKTYWIDPFQGFGIFFGQIRRLFEKPISCVEYYNDFRYPVAEYDLLLEFINTIQPTIEKANVSFCRAYKIDIMISLNLFKTVRDMRWKTFVIREDEYPDVTHKYNHDTFAIKDGGTWLTIDHVLNMNCRIISIGEIILTSDDLSNLLDAWMAGELPKLEHFAARVEDLDLFTVFKDVECKRMDDNVNFTIRNGPYLIEREFDGRNAIVFGTTSIEILVLQEQLI
uniref:F-box domain-containing protein n=2 Tax=Caenorhabditis tropicalis TaxID=1561998 RepID=A0A1I7TN58_9PELO